MTDCELQLAGGEQRAKTPFTSCMAQKSINCFALKEMLNGAANGFDETES